MLKSMSQQNPQVLELFGGMDGPIKRELEKLERFESIEVRRLALSLTICITERFSYKSICSLEHKKGTVVIVEEPKLFKPFYLKRRFDLPV